MGPSDAPPPRARRTPGGAVWLALALAAPCGAQAPADVWFECTLGGRHVGYLHETVRTEADGLVFTDADAEFLVERGGDLSRMRVFEEWVEDAAGRPVRLHARRIVSAEAVELHAEAGRDSLVVTRTPGAGVRGRTAVPLAPDLLFPHAVDALHAARGLAAGDSYAYSYFDTDFERIGRAEVTVAGFDTLSVLGERRRLAALVVRSSLYEGLDVLEWRDADGRLWRSEVPGAGFVQERAAEDDALDTGGTIDLMAWSTVPADTVIEAPREVDRALYEIWIDGEDAAAIIPADGRQSFEGATPRGVLLRVERRVPGAAEDPGGGEDALPPGRSLEGNALLQTDYPLLAAAASQCVRPSGGDPWLGAVRIEEFVHGHIEDKGFGTAFASAAEVLSSRSGDCSEHAVLMAAMARAAGIPSKLVAGLVYSGGGFAYHMWVEVWAGGGWYALDPTLADGSVDATHIKLTESLAEDGVTADISLGILRSVRRLHIRVVEQDAGR